jgi:predicted transcriptional regulator
MELAKWKDRTKFRNKYVKPLIELELLEQTIPDKPRSSNQEYFLTVKGVAFLQILQSKD